MDRLSNGGGTANEAEYFEFLLRFIHFFPNCIFVLFIDACEAYAPNFSKRRVDRQTIFFLSYSVGKWWPGDDEYAPLGFSVLSMYRSIVLFENLAPIDS